MRVYEWIPSKYQIMPTAQRSHRPWSHCTSMINGIFYYLWECIDLINIHFKTWTASMELMKLFFVQSGYGVVKQKRPSLEKLGHFKKSDFTNKIK